MVKRTVRVTLLILALALMAGCSKDKEKEALRSQVATLEEQVKRLETQANDLKSQLDQAVLRSANQLRQAEDVQKALELRLMHHPLSEFSITPSVPTEDGWLVVDGEHTYTLAGHTGATRVAFYWAEASNDFIPQQLGVDANGQDGWSWTANLPFGSMRAFWAEVQYPAGVTVKSGVLPLRSTGK